MEKYKESLIKYYKEYILPNIKEYYNGKNIEKVFDQYISLELSKYDVIESLLQSQRESIEINYKELWETAVKSELFQLYKDIEVDYKQKYLQLMDDLQDISNQIAQEVNLRREEKPEQSSVGKIGCLNRINYLIRKNK